MISYDFILYNKTKNNKLHICIHICIYIYIIYYIFVPTNSLHSSLAKVSLSNGARSGEQGQASRMPRSCRPSRWARSC